MSFLWVILWFLGHPRSKIMLLYPRLKQNILSRVFVVLKSYGWNKILWILNCIFIILEFFVIITSAINISKNLCFTREQSILMLDIISWEIMLKNKIFLIYIDTKHQLADIFTKPPCEVDFCRIRRDLGMCIPC